MRTTARNWRRSSHTSRCSRSSAPENGERSRPIRIQERVRGSALSRFLVADEQEVVARRRRPRDRLADRARLADRSHLEIIRDDDAREAGLVAQVIAHDAPGDFQRIEFVE